MSLCHTCIHCRIKLPITYPGKLNRKPMLSQREILRGAFSYGKETKIWCAMDLWDGKKVYHSSLNHFMDQKVKGMERCIAYEA